MRSLSLNIPIPVLAYVFTALAFAQEPIYLGLASPQSKDAPVRVAFRYRNQHWEPMPSTDRHLTGLYADGRGNNNNIYPDMGEGYPNSVSWTIAFDGRNLGSFRTTRLARFTDRSLLGVQVPAPGTKLPRLTHQRESDPFYNVRLLVIVSKPNFSDPDVWKPFRPTDPSIFDQAFEAFRKRFECGKNCPNAVFTALPDSFRSANGSVVVGVRINDQAVKKSGETSEPLPWEDAWFYIHGKQVITIGTLLTLIDAGDYDGDGVSELVFWYTAYGDGRDAIILFCPRDGSTHEFEIPGDPH